MRISIRMISIATTVFWIFLIGFFVSAVYSIKDVRFDLQEPQIGLTSENKILFSLPITIDNKGFYNIGSFHVTTEISDKEGFIITRGSTFIPVIERSRQIVATHNMTIDIDDLLQNNQDYLFNDTKLQVHETVSLELAEVIPVQASMNLSVPWGAPLYNFALGEIKYTTCNLTHTTVTVLISFENHAFFDLTGSIQIQMYNSTNILVGEGQTTIAASQNAPYRERLQLTVHTEGITNSGYFEAYFSTPLFNFEPLVIPYG